MMALTVENRRTTETSNSLSLFCVSAHVNQVRTLIYASFTIRKESSNQVVRCENKPDHSFSKLPRLPQSARFPDGRRLVVGPWPIAHAARLCRSVQRPGDLPSSRGIR